MTYMNIGTIYALHQNYNNAIQYWKSGLRLLGSLVADCNKSATRFVPDIKYSLGYNSFLSSKYSKL